MPEEKFILATKSQLIDMGIEVNSLRLGYSISDDHKRWDAIEAKTKAGVDQDKKPT